MKKYFFFMAIILSVIIISAAPELQIGGKSSDDENKVEFKIPIDKTNLTTTSVNASEYWITSDGHLDNVAPDLTAILNNTYVPYIGADRDVDLGIYDLTATVLTATSGMFDFVETKDLCVSDNTATNVDAGIIQGGTGDATFSFSLAGPANPKFTLGIDNTDDKFKISRGVTLGTTDVFTIDFTTGDIEIANDLDVTGDLDVDDITADDINADYITANTFDGVNLTLSGNVISNLNATDYNITAEDITADTFISSTGIYGKDDLDTGMVMGVLANNYNFIAGGFQMITLKGAFAKGVEINIDNEDIDFIVNGDTNNDVFVVDAGTEIVSILDDLDVGGDANVIGDIEGNVLSLTAGTSTITYGDGGAVDILNMVGRGTALNLFGLHNIGGTNSMVLSLTAGSAGWSTQNDLIFTSANEDIAFTASTAGKSITFTSPNINLVGDVDVTGNFTGNQIYGEMHFHNDTIGNVTVLNEDVWNNVTAFGQEYSGNFLNGFEQTHTIQLRTQVEGRYKVDYSITFAGTVNNKYHVAVGKNNTVQFNTETHDRISTGSDILSSSGTGFLDLDVDDNVTLMMMNEDSGGDATIFSVNINLIRIGT